ncbi:hypothetical protein V8E51_001560 [Hyaloscypha variabilis]
MESRLPGTAIRCSMCSETMTFEEVKRWRGDATFEKYDFLLFRASLTSDPSIHWCLSPVCESQNGQFHFGSDPQMICSFCNYSTCIHHQLPWHTDETCEEYDHRTQHQKIEMELSLRYIKNKTTPCPKCSIPLEKNEGCFHFTCVRNMGGCGQEFCWICLVRWDDALRRGWRAHKPNCPFHRSDLPANAPMFFADYFPNLEQELQRQMDELGVDEGA